jgi:hypothetical protein
MSPSRTVFAPVVVAVILTGLGGSMALRALQSADSFIPGLNQESPPLLAVEPVASTPTPRLSRRVVIVIIDGLRLDHSYGHDLLDRLRRAGVDAEAQSNYPTYSRPNHVAVLTGVPPAWTGVRNNGYGYPVRVDSIMDRARGGGMRSAYAADEAFGVGIMFHDDFTAIHYAPWEGGFAKAARLIIEQDYPLVVLLPGAVDSAGHAHGARSDEYDAALDRVDRELSQALGLLDLARDTVIVTADHGHTDGGGHGGTEPEVMEVPFILAGAGVRAGAMVGEVNIIDVAPTAAALLGLPAPGHAFGRTLVEALALSPDARASLSRADAARIARNHAVVKRAIDAAAPESEHRRWRRLATVTGLSLLAIALLVSARRLGALHFDWRVILIGVPAFPVTYYALLEIMGQQFSLSAIPDRDDALDQLFHFGLVSMVVQVLAGWVAMRGRVVLRDRLAAANALTACGMAMAWLPAGMMWALFGSRSFIEPPSSAVYVLVPATYIAVACHALAVAVTLGLEILIFFVRAVDPRVRVRTPSG